MYVYVHTYIHMCIYIYIYGQHLIHGQHLIQGLARAIMKDDRACEILLMFCFDVEVKVCNSSQAVLSFVS